jgi:hypothetical protein
MSCRGGCLNTLAEPQKLALPSKEAAVRLTRLMERQLGWKVSEDALAFRLFIKAYWSQISILAHAIHDDPE